MTDVPQSREVRGRDANLVALLSLKLLLLAFFILLNADSQFEEIKSRDERQLVADVEATVRRCHEELAARPALASQRERASKSGPKTAGR